MKGIAGGLRPFARRGQLLRPQWQQNTPVRLTVQLPIRTASTESKPKLDDEAKAIVESIKIPFQGVKHARAVPFTPSYFSREPRFNDMYIGISKLLTKYHHLPTLPSSEAPTVPWSKLSDMRTKLGEPIKAAHYAKVIQIARRLNLIEPSMRPQEVTVALNGFLRTTALAVTERSVAPIDKFGRAVGVGKRKASSARAYVVEGTGEFLVNGKPLNEVFGRVHDRESAAWALLATERLDKYNVWAIVEGGGTTGQAEAITLAVAKGLLAHEPALKPALRRAGCITRDVRTVERKKHGRVKARKAPTWVKR
ncbi:37S ribosomal protein S9 [Stachybotrys elegans]|uniref:Small ribosomal subunit protein uS9m n=1 Tax=Stachybotrys elegans TaxID=80388 RepID=A0A8K0SQH8_9HYPO|nr:37S ribosomal protein S9 [Stachybotrys elegans]